MKNFLITFIYVALTIVLNAQSSEYDHIGRDEFYIVKKGADIKSTSTKKAYKLKNQDEVEQQLGSNFKSKRLLFEVGNLYYNEIIYGNDDLILDVPEDQNLDLRFHIKSANYSLILSNGQTIRVGMKLDEIKTFFPKSYSKRIIDENNGRVSMKVNFSRIINGEFQIEDSWITFIFNKGDGDLKEFYSYVPS